MIFQNIALLDEHYRVKENQYLWVKGKEIVYVGDQNPGTFLDVPEGERVYFGKDKLLMPGFYNIHGHSPMTLMRGYGESMTLMDWLEKKIFPFEAKLNSEDVYWGTQLAIAESLTHGIVSTTDMYFFCDAMAAAITEAEVKNNLSRGIVNPMGEAFWSLDSAQEMVELFETYHNTAGGKLLVDMSIHGEYTSNSETVKEVVDYAKKVGARMHIHLSETQREHEMCKEKRGQTPTEYFSRMGLLDCPTTAAHGVWLESQDYDILREAKATVAVNPHSNMKLGSGLCPIKTLKAHRVNMGIGTDSVASNNSLNFFQELKSFALVAAVQSRDPTTVTPAEVLAAATKNGALAQGRPRAGVIKEGCCADLILVDLKAPEYHPRKDLEHHLVYSGSSNPVVMTMVDGKVLYEEGTFFTMDFQKIKDEVDKRSRRIRDELAL